MLNSKYAGLLGLTLLSLGVATRSQGQRLGNSPYSRLGLGDTYFNAGGVRQTGMGGTGLAAPNGVQVNDLNPALLYYMNRTTWEVAVNSQYKTVRNNIQSQKTGSATLGYFALAVPLSTRWGAAIGLKPFSSVDYESIQTNTLANQTPVQYRYLGQGDLSEAYFGQGLRLAKGLSVGLTASYIFGSIDLSTGSQVQVNSAADTRSVSIDHIHYSDFKFRSGIHYRGKFNDKLNYNLGGVYAFQTNLNGERLRTQETQNADGSQVSGTQADTLAEGTGYAVVPALAQFGISIDNNKNWSINADIAQQQWSKFRSFDEQGGTAGVPLSNTFRAALGGEYVPDPTSVDNYFKRVTYRAGISVAQMPYRPAGQTLYDRAVSWGFSLPVSASPLEATTVSLGFTYGQRGNTTVNQVSGGQERNIKEDYIRAQLGISLNNRWFIKRRIE
ncbi:OmpP1/FadL family transporter [uncultured Hymenobacter sp.]|uniref:OmpP1/FadL family transporter n=1 Tax=uncultured Hymenobacter sp. TaxID=170016 RepID=UPI0035CB2EF2